MGRPSTFPKTSGPQTVSCNFWIHPSANNRVWYGGEKPPNRPVDHVSVSANGEAKSQLPRTPPSQLMWMYGEAGRFRGPAVEFYCLLVYFISNPEPRIPHGRASLAYRPTLYVEVKPLGSALSFVLGRRYSDYQTLFY